MSRGPLLTLIAVLALGVVLLGVNFASGGSTPPAESAAASAPAAPADAPEAAAPEAAAPAADSADDAPATFPANARYDGVTDPRAVPVTLWVEGDRARAYVCDNKGIEVWLNGTARDGVVYATGKNGARLDGRYEGGEVGGNVWVPGYPQWTYTARPQ